MKEARKEGRKILRTTDKQWVVVGDWQEGRS
jgi:hypothetical protein